MCIYENILSQNVTALQDILYVSLTHRLHFTKGSWVGLWPQRSPPKLYPRHLQSEWGRGEGVESAHWKALLVLLVSNQVWEP